MIIHGDNLLALKALEKEHCTFGTDTEYILKNGGELLVEQMYIDSKKLLRKIEGKKAGGEDVSYENELLVNIKKYIER